MEVNHSDSKNEKLQNRFFHIAAEGGIFLKPNKACYHPGEQFEGVIYLNLFTAYPGNALSIKVKVVEKWVQAQDQLVRYMKKSLDTKLPVSKYIDIAEFQP